jgi:polyhydroxyalkanoate synthase
MPAVPDPRNVLDRVRRDVERNVLRARNGIGLAAGSIVAQRPAVGLTPKEVVWRRGRCELWHYHNDDVRMAPPLLIVFSLISRSYILDLSPGNSFIERLLEAGFDVYLLDWGTPDERDANNQLEDYVDDYIPGGIERVRELDAQQGGDGGQVSLLGYCFGGNLALLYAARHPDAPLRNLTVMATPVDFRHLGPLADVFAVGGLDVDAVLDADGNVPPQVMLQAFRSLTPTSEITRYVTLWEKLWSDEYIAAYQAMTRWSSDHLPFPGATARECVEMLLHENAMLTDRLAVGGDAVHLSNITVPFLTVLANRDHIVPPEAAAPLIDLVGSSDKHELRLDAGHIGLIVGRTAARTTIPTIIDFLQRRSEHSP